MMLVSSTNSHVLLGWLFLVGWSSQSINLAHAYLATPIISTRRSDVSKSESPRPRFFLNKAVRLPSTRIDATVEQNEEESVTQSSTAKRKKKSGLAKKKAAKKSTKKTSSKKKTVFKAQQQTKKGSGETHRQNNKRIVQCENAPELLLVLQQIPQALTKPAGGGALNNINFSTAFHRLARHSLQDNGAPRAAILADPRFALLVAALAEFIDSGNSTLKPRELSNISWALTKLRVVPPATAVPLSSDNPPLGSTAAAIRQKVLEVAQARRAGQPSTGPTWIPELSKLSAYILDHVRLSIPQCFDKEGQEFQQQEISNLLWSFATSGRHEEDIFVLLVQRLIQQQATRDPRPQEWSNSVWSFATSQIFRGHEELLEFLAEIMESDQAFVQSFKPQELSNTLWGTATLLSNYEGELSESVQENALKIERKVAEQIALRGHTFKSQELSNSIWALATLGFGQTLNPDHLLNNYVVLRSDDVAGDRELMLEAADTIQKAYKTQLRYAKSQEMNNVAWALARLLGTSNPEIDELLRGIGITLSNPRKRASTQDIGMTLWAMATLGFSDLEIYRSIASRIASMDATRCKPQELSNSVWALATAAFESDSILDKDAFDTTLVKENKRPQASDPITQCFGITAQELMKRPFEFKSQEIKDVLWSFSKIGIRHPKLFRSIALHVVGENENDSASRGLSEFSPQGVGNMAWAFARQAQLCEEVSNRMRGALRTNNKNGRLAVYTTSYFDIGEKLLQRLFVAITENGNRNHAQFSMLSPQDLSNMAWTFSLLGMRHETFVEAAIDQLRQRTLSYVKGDTRAMNTFKGQEIGNLFWALATIRAPVGDLLDLVSSYLRALLSPNGSKGPISAKTISQYFKRQELSNLAWSCAVFGHYPSDLIQVIYTGLLGDGTDPKSINRLYGDGGMQSQEVTTFIYLQLALELDGANEGGFGLPPDFPGEWQFGNPNTAKGKEEFGLSLSTSKVQRSVSDAFSRIDFDHVEEHTITMEYLVDEYGVNLPPRQFELLSIDIANLEHKIAIEVDGPAHFVTQIDVECDDGGFAKKSSGGMLEYQFGWEGQRQLINGPTALKHRLLNKLGWRVISLPFWEWYTMNGDPHAEEEYCKRLLAMR